MKLSIVDRTGIFWGGGTTDTLRQLSRKVVFLV